jgi:hypothetical protein
LTDRWQITRHVLSLWKNKSGIAEQKVTIAAQTLFSGNYALFKPLNSLYRFPRSLRTIGLGTSGALSTTEALCADKNNFHIAEKEQREKVHGSRAEGARRQGAEKEMLTRCDRELASCGMAPCLHQYQHFETSLSQGFWRPL